MLRESVVAFGDNSNAFHDFQSHVGKLVLCNPPSSSVVTSELRFHIWFTLILNLSTRLFFAVHSSICGPAILLCRPRIVLGVSYGRSRPMTVHQASTQKPVIHCDIGSNLWVTLFKHWGYIISFLLSNRTCVIHNPHTCSMFSASTLLPRSSSFRLPPGTRCVTWVGCMRVLRLEGVHGGGTQWGLFGYYMPTFLGFEWVNGQPPGHRELNRMINSFFIVCTALFLFKTSQAIARW